MDSKILTIIIPTYNMEKYLQKCLNSLLVEKNLLSLLEVLIINDGSKDRSSEIAHGYEKNYPAVFRVIDKENGNYGSCINRGLKEASGKYVKILDADDEYITDNFAHLVQVLNEVDADVVISEVFAHDETGNRIHGSKRGLPPHQVVSFVDAVTKYGLTGLFMHEITYRREMLIKMGYKQTEGISYTDNEWAYIPMLNVQSLYYLDEEVYSYLRGRPGQTTDPEVVKRTQTHHIIGIKAMADGVLNSTFDSPEKEQFMYNVLLNRIHVVYGCCLLGMKENAVKKELIDLDQYILMHYPVLARKMEDLAYGRSMRGYIKKWRDSKYSTSFSGYKLLRSAFDKIKRKTI